MLNKQYNSVVKNQFTHLRVNAQLNQLIACVNAIKKIIRSTAVVYFWGVVCLDICVQDIVPWWHWLTFGNSCPKEGFSEGKIFV